MRDLKVTKSGEAMELDGGEIVSTVIQQCVKANPEACGRDLIALVNAAIAAECQSMGIEEPARREAAQRWTGYIGHVRIDEKTVTVTSVGDCYVAVNGVVAAGAEKEIDRMYQGIADGAAAALRRDRQEVFLAIMPELNRRQFAFQNRPDLFHDPAQGAQVTREFYRWLVGRVSEKLGTGRELAQTLCQPIFDGQTGPLWYPAIDGTDVGPEGITIRTFPRYSVETIMLWTDGFRPAGQLGNIRDLGDLEAVSSQYSERTAILVREVNRIP
jgi:hypothetical protein